MSRLLTFLLIATLISSVAVSPAWADRNSFHGGARVHVNGWNALALALIGTVLYLAAKAPPPPNAPAPAYPAQVDPQQPATTAQAAAPTATEPQQNWWYYCAQANGYYPYVTTCPTGWTKVSPVPPGQ